MNAREPETETAFDLVWELWRKCLIDARAASFLAASSGGYVPGLARSVEALLQRTRAVIREYSDENPDLILFEIYTRIHWDWLEPTDRVFEGLLDCELIDFCKGWN